MKRKTGRSKLNYGKAMAFLGGLASLLLMAVIFTSVAFAMPKPYTFNPLVHTRYGTIQGYVDPVNKAVGWKSIPYAKPPVGELRWKAPEDPQHWKGTLVADQPCKPCTQIGGPGALGTEDFVIGSEDCLYLDIFRPSNGKKNLPVYVFIHGGANMLGSLQDYDTTLLDGTKINGAILASKSDVVVVLIQYRLGPLGWFYGALTDGKTKEEQSGNFGNLDHIQALKWIKENIADFGGNPHKVLVTGESAGGVNAMNLVISPLTKDKGLFHGVMSQSGGQGTFTETDFMDKITTPIMKILALFGGADVNIDGKVDDSELAGFLSLVGDVNTYLRNTPAWVLVTAHLLSGFYPSGAVEDGSVIPEGGLIPAVKSGNYNKVPIILGGNKDEFKSFLTQQPYSGYAYSVGVPSSGLGWENLWAVLYGGLTLDTVLPTQNDKDMYEKIAAFESLDLRHEFVDSVARVLADQPDQKVYAYRFDWDGFGDYKFILGATHATEISFFFGYPGDIYKGLAFSPGHDTFGRRALSYAMMEYLANFAYTGNPNHWGLPLWQPWTNRKGHPKAIVFDANKFWPNIRMTKDEITPNDLTTAYQSTLAFVQSLVGPEHGKYLLEKLTLFPW